MAGSVERNIVTVNTSFLMYTCNIKDQCKLYL